MLLIWSYQMWGARDREEPRGPYGHDGGLPGWSRSGQTPVGAASCSGAAGKPRGVRRGRESEGAGKPVRGDFGGGAGPRFPLRLLFSRRPDDRCRWSTKAALREFGRLGAVGREWDGSTGLRNKTCMP
jgi:hypothetical protein